MRPRLPRHKPPLVPKQAPEFVKNVTATIMAGEGDEPAGQRHPRRRRRGPRAHHPVGEAQHRPGDPGVGPGTVHPVRQVLLPLPACHHPHQGVRLRPLLAGAPETFKSVDAKGKENSGLRVDGPGGRRRTAPAAASACRSVPARTSPTPAARRYQHGVPAAAAGDRAGELPVLPRTSRPRPHPGTCGDGQGQPAVAAAVRVLRGLRRLRRDPLHQAAHPAGRRPAAHRQRHRVLQHLRGQPADHPVCQEQGRARARRGTTPSSRTRRSSATAFA